jgi:NADH dehydrogenase
LNKHKVLIVGGGFAGIKAALELREHEAFEVTLLSNNTDFSYYPTLYHTATGGLRAQSFIPLKEIFTDKRVRFVLGTAKTLDREKKIVRTGDSRKFHYDTLILALGSKTNYFGIPGLAEHSYGIKSAEEIARFKRHLHEQLLDDRNPELNYIIVGGGPTGIELAGALPEYIRAVRRNHKLPRRALHIDLVEAGPRLLPRCSKATSRAVTKRLRKLGVKLYLKAAVQGVTADELVVNGKPISSHTVIWTAGVANNPFFKENGFALTERGKVKVDAFLEAEPGIYVLGDNNDAPYSGLAQTALYDAETVSRNLIHLIEQKEMKAYKPTMPVTVIPVGRDWAAVEWGKLHFAGRTGWLLRSAADWIGFNDVQPWYKATEQWFTEFGTQEDCPTCNVARMHQPEMAVEH